jgi:rod shape-determining protein MreD
MIQTNKNIGNVFSKTILFSTFVLLFLIATSSAFKDVEVFLLAGFSGFFYDLFSYSRIGFNFLLLIIVLFSLRIFFKKHVRFSLFKRN